MIMTPMTDIMVSDVPEEKILGREGEQGRQREPWPEEAQPPLHDSRVPMRPVGRTIRTITSRR